MWEWLKPKYLLLLELVKKTALELGCEEKMSPGTVSASRLIAALWALTATATALSMVLVLGKTDHLIVAEMVAGTLAALGLRSRAKGGDS